MHGRKVFIALLILCLGALAAKAQGTAPSGAVRLTEDRFWILWERVKHFGTHCPAGAQCTEVRSYSSRPLETNNTGFIFRLFGVAGAPSKAADLPKDHKDGPRICGPTKRI